MLVVKFGRHNRTFHVGRRGATTEHSPDHHHVAGNFVRGNKSFEQYKDGAKRQQLGLGPLLLLLERLLVLPVRALEPLERSERLPDLRPVP